MGVDSGLPDFRGNQGFWKAYPPLERLGISFVSMADPVWFTRDPELAWGFYGHRLGLYRATEPHAGFAVLKRWGQNAQRQFRFHLQRGWAVPGGWFSERRNQRMPRLDQPPPMHSPLQRRNLERRNTGYDNRRGDVSGHLSPARVSTVWGSRATQCPHVRRLALDSSPYFGAGRTPRGLADLGTRQEIDGGRGRSRFIGADGPDDIRTSRLRHRCHTCPDQPPRTASSSRPDRNGAARVGGTPDSR